MKKALSLLVILSMLVLPTWGWPYMEGAKKLCIDEKICITLPEKAPDFTAFKGNILGQRAFANGNVIMVVEMLNDADTVGVIIVLVKVGEKSSVIGMQVTYAPETFAKYDIDKAHVSDSYEDSTFTEKGKLSNTLMKVDKLTDYKLFAKFIEGVKI
jgi:hypothetical protein